MAKKTYASAELAREAILDAAEADVLANGPSGMRISEVARMAGVAHPNVIYHFRSRDGLITAMAKRARERTVGQIETAISTAMSTAQDDDMASALSDVLSTVFAPDRGKMAVWFALNDIEAPLGSQLQSFAAMAHTLRENFRGKADPEDTKYLVLLISLALMGNAVLGPIYKSALELKDQSDDAFMRWFSERILMITE